ncbi:aminotransferase class-III [Aureobasidium pullulans EXF-150]|uniref:Aminotransferase class-III n=1 Tax=Aureobasidium pullulans EXF-150 TaxID=1043002 RepID=A0A074XCS1_AURPU|nr:aminotransferase class-III [Aureobasidium pullulans EXF-150]KEQ79832.1 aminotransferase class-III [Aureobasidium pullulans EXF-150]
MPSHTIHPQIETLLPAKHDSQVTSKLDSLLEKLTQNYKDQNKLSQHQHEEASMYLPGGSTRSVLHFDPFPMTLASGHDCHVTSLDGKEYLDLVSEYSAALFGHSQPEIMDAIRATLEQGINLGGPNKQEAVLAKQLVDRFPSIEKVRFCNSGSEANTMALGITMAYTGRKKILVFENGYHGAFTNFGDHPNPFNIPHDFVIAKYNDIEHTKSLLSPDLAAIILEPMLGAGGMIPATKEFLQFLRNAATQIGAVLIFDEIITSRLHIHGLQTHYNVYPDMTTLGKYLGGGFSFGAFGGNDEIMAMFNPGRGYFHSGTYNNNLFSMSAGVAAGKLLTEDKIAKANALGDKLRDGINEMAKKCVPEDDVALMKATGFGSQVGLHYVGDEQEKLRDCVFFFMLDQGIYMGKRGFISINLVHEEHHIDMVIEAFRRFFKEL